MHFYIIPWVKHHESANIEGYQTNCRFAHFRSPTRSITTKLLIIASACYSSAHCLVQSFIVHVKIVKSLCWLQEEGTALMPDRLSKLKTYLLQLVHD